MSRVIPLLLRLKGFFLDVLHPRCNRWTRPLTLSLPLGTLRDLGRSKSELTAENVLLRQQLVLLARFVRTWKQTLFIVQPDTLLCWHRELFRLVWKRKFQAASHLSRAVLATWTIRQKSGVFWSMICLNYSTSLGCCATTTRPRATSTPSA